MRVDFSEVMERMRRVRAGLSEHDSVHRVTKLGIDMYLGDAHFTGSNTLEIDGQTLHFIKAVIATDSRPAAPPIPGLAETGHLTNEKVWDLTRLPPRLVVIGAGPIGAALAQAFRRFGSEVTVFDVVPRLLGREDEQAADVIHPYPTEAEAIRKVADAYNRTRLTPSVAKLFKMWFGWRR